MQTSDCVTATVDCAAQTAESLTAMPDCATQPWIAVTPTGNVVTHEATVASHEADLCVAVAAAHHPPAMAPFGLVIPYRATIAPADGSSLAAWTMSDG